MPSLLAPLPIPQYFDTAGKPLAGGQLTALGAGTTTPSPLYAGAPLQVPLEDPVMFDAAGRPATVTGQPQELWIDSALAYKFQLAAADGTLLQTVDNVTSAFAVPVVTVTTTGSPASVPVPKAPIVTVEFTQAGTLQVAGFPGGQPGQLLLLRSRTGFATGLLHLDAGTAVTDRLTNFATSAPTYLVSPGVALYQHGSAGQGWSLISHTQGALLPWTPTWTFGGASVGLTYNTRDGQVLLQGQYATGSLRLQLTAKGTSTGQVLIQGWPYLWQQPPAQTVHGPYVGYGLNFTGLPGRLTSSYSAQGVSPQQIYLWAFTGTTPVAVSDAFCTNTSDLIVQFRYPVV